MFLNFAMACTGCCSFGAAIVVLLKNVSEISGSCLICFAILAPNVPDTIDMQAEKIDQMQYEVQLEQLSEKDDRCVAVWWLRGG